MGFIKIKRIYLVLLSSVMSKLISQWISINIKHIHVTWVNLEEVPVDFDFLTFAYYSTKKRNMYLFNHVHHSTKYICGHTVLQLWWRSCRKHM